MRSPDMDVSSPMETENIRVREVRVLDRLSCAPR